MTPSQKLDALYAKYNVHNGGDFDDVATREDKERAYDLKRQIWGPDPEGSGAGGARDTEISVPRALATKLAALGVQDLYTDAPEYSARVAKMKRAVRALQELI